MDKFCTMRTQYVAMDQSMPAPFASTRHLATHGSISLYAPDKDRIFF